MLVEEEAEAEVEVEALLLLLLFVSSKSLQLSSTTTGRPTNRGSSEELLTMGMVFKMSASQTRCVSTPLPWGHTFIVVVLVVVVVVVVMVVVVVVVVVVADTDLIEGRHKHNKRNKKDRLKEKYQQEVTGNTITTIVNIHHQLTTSNANCWCRFQHSAVASFSSSK